MTDRDLLKMALEALEHIQRSIGMGTATIHFGSSTWEQSDAAINVLRERLARPEPYDQTALELCDKCGWKAQIPGDVCVMCKWQKQPAAEAEEGCTPADARKLREANHALAQENHELRERLAQPEPEPVAWQCKECGGCHVLCLHGRKDVPLYTEQPRREWQGLPEDEISRLRHLIDPTAGWSYIAFARAINDALREKNT